MYGLGTLTESPTYNSPITSFDRWDHELVNDLLSGLEWNRRWRLGLFMKNSSSPSSAPPSFHPRKKTRSNNDSARELFTYSIIAEALFAEHPLYGERFDDNPFEYAQAVQEKVQK